MVGMYRKVEEVSKLLEACLSSILDFGS